MWNCVLQTSFYDLVLSKIMFSPNFLFFSFSPNLISFPISNSPSLVGGLNYINAWKTVLSLGRCGTSERSCPLVGLSVAKLYRERASHRSCPGCGHRWACTYICMRFLDHLLIPKIHVKTIRAANQAGKYEWTSRKSIDEQADRRTEDNNPHFIQRNAVLHLTFA